jgi:hypothetical protein
MLWITLQVPTRDVAPAGAAGCSAPQAITAPHGGASPEEGQQPDARAGLGEDSCSPPRG